jgi:membrane-associated phospholipid phosphatase
MTVGGRRRSSESQTTIVVSWVTRDWPLHRPELALDRALPVPPAWVLIYLSYLVSPLLPFLVIGQEELIRRTVLAWLLVWIAGFTTFLVYPTTLPRPHLDDGNGFFAWVLLGVYQADPPRNCFPSLHVATPFVSAFACFRAHRGVGLATGVWAVLIAVSTLFTKQHYVADVIGGVLLASVAYAVFLRTCPRMELPESAHRAAPVLMLGLLGVYGLLSAVVFVAYLIR